jgi:hypothetical protein
MISLHSPAGARWTSARRCSPLAKNRFKQGVFARLAARLMLATSTKKRAESL